MPTLIFACKGGKQKSRACPYIPVVQCHPMPEDRPKATYPAVVERNKFIIARVRLAVRNVPGTTIRGALKDMGVSKNTYYRWLPVIKQSAVEKAMDELDARG